MKSMLDLIIHALAQDDTELANKVICQCFQLTTETIMDVVNSFPREDTPIVVATMLVAGNCLRNMVDDSGKALIDTLMKNCTAIGINMNEIKSPEV